MANLKDIAATLAILGSGALVMSGCGKDKPATEVPAGDEAAPPSEGSCGAAAPEGEEADPEGEASCSAAEGEGEGEGSCGGK
jgi:hypothetical protein